ncbi:unnamed protein product [Paramecium sonneborni]|uniref:Transmembrane protein n=1 Tax=Paramecium sonneborni TaxID=65129 RepID=A0A8S1RB22_9CILI|nr:unnamed protein product [Paramecium sonneborni]
MQNNFNRKIYFQLQNKYFAKILTDQTKEEFHIHLLTCIHALNMIVIMIFHQGLFKSQLILEESQNQKKELKKMKSLMKTHFQLNFNFMVTRPQSTIYQAIKFAFQ